MPNDKITGNVPYALFLDEFTFSEGNKVFDPAEFAKGGFIMGYDPAQPGAEGSVISQMSKPDYTIPFKEPGHTAFTKDPFKGDTSIAEAKTTSWQFDIETIGIDNDLWKVDPAVIEEDIKDYLHLYQSKSLDAYTKMMMGTFSSEMAGVGTPPPSLKELSAAMMGAVKDTPDRHPQYDPQVPAQVAGDPRPLNPYEKSSPARLKQALYDRVLQGMRRQRCKSVAERRYRPGPLCVYRSETGARCAVGMLIPKRNYHYELEGGVTDRVARATIIPDPQDKDIREFLSDMQTDLHDGICVGSDFMPAFEHHAQVFARCHKLEYREPGSRYAVQVQPMASLGPPSEDNTAFKDTFETVEF